MGTKNSVIQSTLKKITVLIFCILLMLYFYIAQLYWDKEVLKREFELLTVASAAEVQIKAHYQEIQDIKSSQGLTNTEKINQINSSLQSPLDTIFRENPKTIIGYSDKELSTIIFNASYDTELSNTLYLQKIAPQLMKADIPKFISDPEVIDWDGKGVIASTVPVYYQNQIIGHTWAMISSGQLFYKSYLNYSKVFVPSIVLWILVLQLIKRSINKIQISLDAFSQMITTDKLSSYDGLDLPELKPVFERIKTHLDNLQLLNSNLEESKAKLLTIMEGISDGFFSLDKQWQFTFVNKKTKKIVNKENMEMEGKAIWGELTEFMTPLTVSNLRHAIDENIPMHWEDHLPSEQQRYLEYHAYPFAHGLTVFFRDITEIKQRENELVRLERLNLIGQMAAGISHEVRNPLTTVRGFLQMLEGRSDSAQNKEYMEIMISEIDRANAIITDFLSLAKSNADSIKQENINEIITRILPMLQADAYNSNKDVIINMEDVPDLMLNESEIRQLILNLVRNGLEETPEEGKVYISTYLENNCVVLAIKDEGKGIPAEVQEKIGTPFITTKETGTGLGLAISIGIINRHKAKFEYRTGDSGTTFIRNYWKNSFECRKKKKIKNPYLRKGTDF